MDPAALQVSGISTANSPPTVWPDVIATATTTKMDAHEGIALLVLGMWPQK